jgi:putative nucleotidyltransferase with HDIG domain
MSGAQARWLKAGAPVLLAMLVAGAALSSRASDWNPIGLVVALTVLATVGERVKTRAGRMGVSASALIASMAMALLGPAPAVAICFTAKIIDSVITDGPRLPGRRFALVWNLAMYVDIMLGALAIRTAVDGGVSRGSISWALVVVGAITAATVINFLLAAIWIRAFDGGTVNEMFKRQFVPLLPWIAAPNLLAGGLATLYIRVGAASLVLVGVLLAAFYLLLAELLKSRQRSEQLASLQVGVLVTMVRTLSLRDKSTARHSAAVARYARSIAKAAGFSEDDQQTVHTAGLLHDIGKFAFPDRILLAPNGLSDEDWGIVKAHPSAGADLVRRVDGYEEISKIILAHHERPDGAGYPFGLSGEAIPQLSRMISIADVYDVMTGRDTYRDPVSREEAIAELRRVADKQLDAELVEVFVDVLNRQSVGFTHTEDADFEAELEFEERVRELAAPRGRRSPGREPVAA